MNSCQEPIRPDAQVMGMQQTLQKFRPEIKTETNFSSSFTTPSTQAARIGNQQVAQRIKPSDQPDFLMPANAELMSLQPPIDPLLGSNYFFGGPQQMQMLSHPFNIGQPLFIMGNGSQPDFRLFHQPQFIPVPNPYFFPSGGQPMMGQQGLFD